MTRAAIGNECTLVCAWSHQECARYLETFKRCALHGKVWAPAVLVLCALLRSAVTALLLLLHCSYESKPAEAIRKDVGSDYVSRLNEALTSVRGVNKTDVKTLGERFGSVAALLGASKQELQACPGIGPTKVKRLYET